MKIKILVMISLSLLIGLAECYYSYGGTNIENDVVIHSNNVTFATNTLFQKDITIGTAVGITNTSYIGYNATGITNIKTGWIIVAGTNYSYTSYYTNSTSARTNLCPEN